MGKAGVLQNGRSLHIPDREQEVIWAAAFTQILLILSHISVAQGVGTRQPSWHNSILDGAQPSLSMPQRHPALKWSSVSTLQRQCHLCIYQSCLSPHPAHNLKNTVVERQQLREIPVLHSQGEPMKAGLKLDSFEKQGMLLGSQAGKFWPLTFTLNVHVWQTTIWEFYFIYNYMFESHLLQKFRPHLNF